MMKRYHIPPFPLLLLLSIISLIPAHAQVTVGADRSDLYIPLLQGKRVALYTNHTGRLSDGTMTVDHLIDNGINVVTLFSPEHGIRGNAEAGVHVASSVDDTTGIPIVSLFGKKYRQEMTHAVDDAEIIVIDIQDVGLRYYTYHITMLELMNQAVRAHRPVMILDRPNPLGMTVDGPILDMRYASGVGRLPIPTVHGMTLGELALMINGEGWLDNHATVELTVIPCEGYTHATRYRLPVPPSPNLRDMTAIYLYPSLCYFEATPVSLGRGTDFPFKAYGHPAMKDKNNTFSFTPKQKGQYKPPQAGEECYGEYLGDIDDETLISRGIDLSYLIKAYKKFGSWDKFFTKFFENLMGRGDIRPMIERGTTADEIKATWADDIKNFEKQRQPYLIYPIQ